MLGVAKSRYVAPLLVFLVAFLVRIGYLVALKSSVLFDVMVVDAAFYDQWGQKIAAGDWLGGAKAFYDPPLYAYFLGVVYRIFGHDYFLVRLVQIIIGSAHCVVIYALGKKVLDSRAGLLAGIFAALYKPLFYYDAAIMKAFLTATLVDLALLLVLLSIEKRKLILWFLTGICMGLVSMLTVNLMAMSGIGLALFAYGFIRGGWLGGRIKTLVSCAVWVLGLTLVLTPVVLRNHKVSGQYIIVSSYLGQNFYTGNNPYNKTGNYARLPFVRANPKYEEEDFKREALKRTGRKELSPRGVSNYWMAEALLYISKEPADFLWRIATRLRIFWNVYEVPDTYNLDFEARNFTPYLRMPFFNFGFIGPLGLVGLALFWRKRRALWPFFVFLAVYMGTVLPFFVFDRYRLPAVGTLLVFAGPAAVAAWELRPRVKNLVVTCLVFIGLVIVVNYPLPYHVPDSEGFLNLGTLWRDKGDREKAAFYYKKSIELNPAQWEAPYFLATVLREDGKCEEAIIYYAMTIRLFPAFSDGYGGMGLCLEELGRDDKAEEFYIEALKKNVRLTEIRLKLIHLLIRHNDLEAARRQILSLRVIEPMNKEALELEKQYGSPSPENFR